MEEISGVFDTLKNDHKLNIQRIPTMLSFGTIEECRVLFEKAFKHADKTVNELIIYFITNKKLAAICAAPSLIGELGLLKGKKYTCYPGFNSEKYEGTYLNQYYVTDGNLYTARSLAASIEFGLLLVAALKGEQAKKELMEEIVY